MKDCWEQKSCECLKTHWEIAALYNNKCIEIESGSVVKLHIEDKL